MEWNRQKNMGSEMKVKGKENKSEGKGIRKQFVRLFMTRRSIQVI